MAFPESSIIGVNINPIYAATTAIVILLISYSKYTFIIDFSLLSACFLLILNTWFKSIIRNWFITHEILVNLVIMFSTLIFHEVRIIKVGLMMSLMRLSKHRIAKSQIGWKAGLLSVTLLSWVEAWLVWLLRVHCVGIVVSVIVLSFFFSYQTPLAGN